MSKPSKPAQLVEAALFVSSAPVSASQLSKKLNTPLKTIDAAITELQQTLDNRGICVVQSSAGYELAVSPKLRTEVTAFTSEVAPTLSQSSLEVLTIIAYEGPCGKTLIDEIRGTTSDNSVRALLSRDLIAQLKSIDGEPTNYELTSFAWRSLGITGKDQLPPKPRSKKDNFHATE
jgi:segregation and condensation protein B